jgi:hypothetical protein
MSTSVETTNNDALTKNLILGKLLMSIDNLYIRLTDNEKIQPTKVLHEFTLLD